MIKPRSSEIVACTAGFESRPIRSTISGTFHHPRIAREPSAKDDDAVGARILDCVLADVGLDDDAHVLATRLRESGASLDELADAASDWLLLVAGRVLADRRAANDEDVVDDAAFRWICRQFERGIPTIVWRGELSQLDSSAAAALRTEAAELRPSAERRDRQIIAEPGPASAAARVARSEGVLELVGGLAGGPVQASRQQFYLFYEEPGDGVGLHVDGHEFALNLLVCVEHVAPSPSRSTLTLVTADGSRDEYALTPGEVVVFSAGSVFHGRSAVAPDERVCMLSSGYSGRART